MPKAHRQKASLKTSLAAYQSRMRDNEVVESHLLQGQKRNHGNSSGKASSKSRQNQRKPVIPFSETDRILLIGEGNFSFARALLHHAQLQHLPPQNLTATAYDTEKLCLEKYPEAKTILEELRSKGVQLLFGVDATALDQVAELKKRSWDRIVWNFPHVGKGISDQDRNIRANQVLILDFFRSASSFLATGRHPQLHRRTLGSTEGKGHDSEDASETDDSSDLGTRGTIILTLRNAPPYTEWEIPKLAKSPPLAHPEYSPYRIFRSFEFPRQQWTQLGYEHRMTKGFVEGIGTGADRAREQGKVAEERCWEFYLA